MLADLLEQPKTKSASPVAKATDDVNLDTEMLGLSNRLYAMATKMELHASNEAVSKLLDEQCDERSCQSTKPDALIQEITADIDSLEQKIAFLSRAF